MTCIEWLFHLSFLVSHTNTHIHTLSLLQNAKVSYIIHKRRQNDIKCIDTNLHLLMSAPV